MLVSGNSLKVTSELLGHSTISLTFYTYTHVIDASKKEAAIKIDHILNIDIIAPTI